MKPIVVCVAIAGALLALSASAQPTSPLRGMELYENHCSGCHASRVHIRDPEKRKARSLAQIESWIWHWAKELKLTWTEEEVKEVLAYLNTRYYRY